MWKIIEIIGVVAVFVIIFIILTYILKKWYKRYCRNSLQDPPLTTISTPPAIVVPPRQRNEVITAKVSTKPHQSKVLIHVPNDSQQRQFTLNVPKRNTNSSIYIILGNENNVPAPNTTALTTPGPSTTSNLPILLANNTAINNYKTFASAPPIQDEYFKQPLCNPLFQNVQKSESSTAKPPTAKMFPKLIIFRVRSAKLTDESEFVRKIIQCNKLTHSNCHISIVYKIPNEDSLFHVIVKVDPKSRDILLAKGLYVDRIRYKIEDSFHVTQCNKCGAFGHIGGKCNRQKSSCLKCAKNHDTKECSNLIISCINCIVSNGKFQTKYDIIHTAKDKKCPMYLKEISIIKSKTNYATD